MEIVTIQSAISSLKAAGDIAKSLLGIRDESLIRDKVIELQSLILNAQSDALGAQSDQFALLHKLNQMEKEISAIKNWEEESIKYKLEPIGGNRGAREAFAYSYIQNEHNNEPAHKICAHCYQEGKKSILQSETRTPGMDIVLVCHRCKSDIYTSGAWRLEHAKRK